MTHFLEEQLYISAPQETRLSSTFHTPSSPGPWPAVFFLHGIRGQKSENHRLFVLLARRLAAVGIASLRFDFGEAGDSYRAGADEWIVRWDYRRSDTIAVLEWLQNEPRVDSSRIGGIGLSAGCRTLCEVLRERPSEVSAVSLWGNHARPIVSDTSFPLVDGKYFDYEGFLVPTEDRAKMCAVDTVSILESYSGLIQVIHGDKDTVADARPLAEASLENMTFHWVAGADHVFRQWRNTEAAVELARDFFARALR